MLTAEIIEKHNSRESCWVVVGDHAYDLTEYLDSHPGGAEIILRFAGKDATEEYAPIHPVGTIEKGIPKEKHLGMVDTSTFQANKTPGQAAFPKASPKDSFLTNETTKAPDSKKLSSRNPIPIDYCINLDDMEQAAKKKLSERAWTYFSSASEDLISHHNNLNDWARVLFRPRIMRNVKNVDMQRKILGFKSSLPFFIAPAAMGQLGHPDGELCLVRGSAKYNIPYCASDGSSIPHVELAQCLRKAEDGSGVLFYQLYVKKKKDLTIQRIRMAREFGYKALVITVDTAVMGIREEDDRYRIRDAMTRNGKYVPVWGGRPKGVSGKGGDDYVLRGVHSSTLDWQDLQWIKEEWGNAGPLCVKGILTAEDAKIACDNGVDSIYLSNHGGRQIDSGPSSLRALLEIRRFYPEVFDKCEVLVDGGIRRSKDILKALCLGATAVGVGRPFMYALSAYGTEGVFKTIQILSDELETSMRLLGVTSIDELRPSMVNTGELDSAIMRGIPEFDKSVAKL